MGFVTRAHYACGLFQPDAGGCTSNSGAFSTLRSKPTSKRERELHSTFFVGSGKDKLDLVDSDLGIAPHLVVLYLVANVSTAVPLPGKFNMQFAWIFWSENNGIMGL